MLNYLLILWEWSWKLWTFSTAVPRRGAVTDKKKTHYNFTGVDYCNAPISNKLQAILLNHAEIDGHISQSHPKVLE